MDQGNYIRELAEKVAPPSWKICQNAEDLDFNNSLTLHISLIVNDYKKDNDRLGHISGPVEAGHCAIIINKNNDFSIEATLLHELAHVAVKRLVAWKRQALSETMHGPVFQRAYQRMLARAWKYINADTINEIEAELEYYKSNK